MEQYLAWKHGLVQMLSEAELKALTTNVTTDKNGRRAPGRQEWHNEQRIDLPRPLRVGDVIGLSGEGGAATLNLESDNIGILLHFNPRRPQGCVVRNNHEGGRWLNEERGGGYGFARMLRRHRRCV